MSNFAYALACFLAAQACIWWNNWLMEQMIKAVNAHRPSNQQISSAFANRAKTRLIESEYRRLYPHSKLGTWRYVSLNLGLVSFLMTAVMFFKPSR